MNIVKFLSSKFGPQVYFISSTQFHTDNIGIFNLTAGVKLNKMHCLRTGYIYTSDRRVKVLTDDLRAECSGNYGLTNNALFRPQNAAQELMDLRFIDYKKRNRLFVNGMVVSLKHGYEKCFIRSHVTTYLDRIKTLFRIGYSHISAKEFKRLALSGRLTAQQILYLTGWPKEFDDPELSQLKKDRLMLLFHNLHELPPLLVVKLGSKDKRLIGSTHVLKPLIKCILSYSIKDEDRVDKYFIGN